MYNPNILPLNFNSGYFWTLFVGVGPRLKALDKDRSEEHTYPSSQAIKKIRSFFFIIKKMFALKKTRINQLGDLIMWFIKTRVLSKDVGPWKLVSEKSDSIILITNLIYVTEYKCEMK